MRFGSLALVVCVAAYPVVSAVDPKPTPAAAPSAAATAPKAAVAPVTAATASAKPAPVKTITGKITKADGKPAEGATVRAIPMPQKSDGGMRGARKPDVPKALVVKTDASGTFLLSGLTGGPFALRIEATGFAPAFAPDVPAGATLNFRMKPGVAVAGRVLDLTSQKPVAGAAVTALERDAARFGRDAAHTVLSGDDGTFVVNDCAPGVVALDAIAPAKARASLDRVVAKALAPGEERKPDANTLYLLPGGRIAGRAIGPDGKPLADAFVTATPSDGSLFAMFREGRGAQRTDADGKFSFDGVAAGNKYTVRATKEGLTSRDEGPIAIEAGTDRGDLELKLESGALLSFRLVTAQDTPVKDVEARVAAQTGRRRGMAFSAGDVDRDKIVSQGDGKFLIKSLDAGTFDVTLQPPDFADVVREAVKLKSGETTDLGTIRVKESKSIAGRITDTSGQPIAGASISAMWVDADMRLSREARSAADGHYRLAGLADQPLRNVMVRATGYANGTREGASPGDTAVDFTLEKTGAIVGRVLLPGGAAPAAFRVQSYPEAKGKEERAGFRMVIGSRPDENQIFTDPSGNFRLDGIESGTVTVIANADGKAPARKNGLKVASDQVADVGTLTLEDGRTLRGRVVAAKDDAPVPGATVSVSQPQGFAMSLGRDTAAGVAISALDGTFEIAGLEARTYAVDVSQPDYSPNTGRVEITADADTDDFVVKLSRGGSITGLVRDAQKQTMPNVGVLLTKIPMGGGPQTVSTGPDGRYTFDKIAPGEYMVIRAPTGGGPLMLIGGMKQVVVKEGETTVHDLDESAKINVTGRVLKAGQPVGNAMIFFSSGDGNGPPTDLKQSRTDADGRYQIGLDAAGAYSVVVSTGGMFMGGGRSAIPVQVPDQPNPVLDITMKTAGISGRVVNVEGKPVSGAMVTATANGAAPGGGGGHRDPGMRAQSEPDGSFLIDGVDPGTYTIAASASGYRDASTPPVTVSNENDVPSIEVRLEPGRMLRGRVVDVNGNGIAGAFVSAGVSGAAPSGRDASPGTTDVNGSFMITVPADGPIDVAAFAAGFPPARAVSYQPQDGVELTLKTPRPAHVRVSVLDASGAALAGASVTCRANPYYLQSGFLQMINPTPPTGADGTTVVSALAPGSYELNVASGAKKATQAVTVTEGAEVVATVTLP